MKHVFLDNNGISKISNVPLKRLMSDHLYCLKEFHDLKFLNADLPILLLQLSTLLLL
jgi:hypothetical protein